MPESDFATRPIALSDPNLAAFPLFEQASSITVDLGPGEVLYLPEG